MAKITWKNWNPGLDNDALTLKEVLDTLPGNDPQSINFIVRLFENPKSPIAFKGAISLERHDCVHILLGRGLLPQDEAFVIGYTMGTAPTISAMETWLFKFVSEKFYPDPYSFSKNDLKAYDLGVQAGKENPVKEIYDFAFENNTQRTLGELRTLLGVNTGTLKSYYREEGAVLPNTKESKRLPS